jgi:hypothetical protein
LTCTNAVTGATSPRILHRLSTTTVDGRTSDPTGVPASRRSSTHVAPLGRHRPTMAERQDPGPSLPSYARPTARQPARTHCHAEECALGRTLKSSLQEGTRRSSARMLHTRATAARHARAPDGA